MAHDAFTLEGVGVTFGGNSITALVDIDLSVGASERVAIVGPSGSGKTTLLRLLNGAVSPTAGRVETFSQDIAALRPAVLRQLRADIALIPQDLGLVPNVRVVQNVVMGRLGKRGTFASIRDFLHPRKSDLETVYQILERVGIAEKLYHRTDTLSGGQQQRVAIARALFQNPKAMLADEPVSSVDPARARDAVELITKIAGEERLALCMSLHNVGLAREFFPRIIGLKRGRIVFDDKPDAVPEAAFDSLFQLEERELINDG